MPNSVMGGHRIAGLGPRLIAQVLDMVLGVVPLLGFAILAFVLELDDVIKGWIVILGVAFWIVYMAFQDGMGRGQSWGKRLQSIAVVDEHTGRPCNYKQSLVRNLSLLVLSVIDCLFIFGASRQRLGDILAKTMVVYVSRE